MTHHHLRREKTILAAEEAAARAAGKGAGKGAGKAVKDRAGAVVAILAAVEAAKVRVAAVIPVAAVVVEAAVAKALAVAAAVIRAGVAAAAEGPEVAIQEAAAEEGVKAPAAAAHLAVVVVEVEAAPEDPAAAVKVAEAARVLVGVRAAVVADKGAAMAGVPAVGAIDSYKGSGGCRLPDGPFSFPDHRTADSMEPMLHPPAARGGGLWCTLAGFHHNREALVSTPRGRQARLRTEHASLYPGLKPGVWMPVEKLLSLVTDLIHKDRSQSGIITGRRLLHDEHFEYRGTSARPEGLPGSQSRLSDSSAEPSPANESSGPLGRAG